MVGLLVAGIDPVFVVVAAAAAVEVGKHCSKGLVYFVGAELGSYSRHFLEHYWCLETE